MSKPVLYSYWRSSCSFRVRIALEYKGIDYDYKAVNLLKGEQRSDENLGRNSMGVVPTLVADGEQIGQSLAIMEFVEERFPARPLLPRDFAGRAKVRQICNLIGSGIQPIQNLAVLVKIGKEFGDKHKQPWANYWITDGFVALEKLLAETSGRYCYGDEVTMADACLVPQIFNSKRFGVDLARFPIIDRIGKECMKHPAFQRAAPDQMPDAKL